MNYMIPLAHGTTWHGGNDWRRHFWSSPHIINYYYYYYYYCYFPVFAFSVQYGSLAL